MRTNEPMPLSVPPLFEFFYSYFLFDLVLPFALQGVGRLNL